MEWRSTSYIVRFLSLCCWNLLYFYCIFRWFAMPNTTCSSFSPPIAVFAPVTQASHFFFYPIPHPVALDVLFAVIFSQRAIHNFWRWSTDYPATCCNTFLRKFYIFVWEILQTFSFCSLGQPLIVCITLCLFLLFLHSTLFVLLLEQVIKLLLVELLIIVLVLCHELCGKALDHKWAFANCLLRTNKLNAHLEYTIRC